MSASFNIRTGIRLHTDYVKKVRYNVKSRVEIDYGCAVGELCLRQSTSVNSSTGRYELRAYSLPCKHWNLFIT